jgi:hypothetical protein
LSALVSWLAMLIYKKITSIISEVRNGLTTEFFLGVCRDNILIFVPGLMIKTIEDNLGILLYS